MQPVAYNHMIKLVFTLFTTGYSGISGTQWFQSLALDFIQTALIC